MEEIKVRQVEEGDLDGCFEVEDNCYGDEGATKEKIAQRIELFPEGFFVAEDGGRIVGIINGTSTDREDLSDETLKDMGGFSEEGENVMVFSVAGHPDYRKKGIARLLLERFIENCRKINKKKILLMCRKELIPLYEKFGFIYMQKSESTHGNMAWYEMYLNL